MADSKTAIEKLLKKEGGLLRDEDGVTNFGICSRFNPGIDVEHLTREQAAKWYEEHFWKPMGLALITDQEIADQLLDTGVNCGAETAVRLAQRAYNDLYPIGPLELDGKLGPITAAALNNLHYPRAYRNALTYERVRLYLDILARNPGKEKNRLGWLNRI
jgi:lysozyme family protein